MKKVEDENVKWNGRWEGEGKGKGREGWIRKGMRVKGGGRKEEKRKIERLCGVEGGEEGRGKGKEGEVRVE